MPNLPSLSKIPSSPSFIPYSTCQYTNRSNGSKGEKGKIIPHPPARQRPVSANPTCGSFQTFKKPTIAGNWTNGFLNCDNAGVKALDSVIDLNKRLHETEDKLNNLVNSENESFKKDCVIESLREEIEYLRGSCNETTASTTYSTGCHQKIADLHNQIQLINEDNDHLRVANETLRRENDNLRLETDNLRKGDDTSLLCSENQNLRDEMERLNVSYHEVNQQVAELNILLSQSDHKIALLENDIERANKEKCQATMIVTTLQKEVTSKEEQLQKTRADMDRHKLELENKKNEVCTMASRLAKNLDYKNTVRDLKCKEEEVSKLKYELKCLDDTLLLKDGQLLKLHDDVKEANKHIAESENIYKCQLKSYQDKLRGKETSLKNTNIQLTATRLALEENKERQRVNNANEIEAVESISNILCKIEKRLVKNGRSCKSLNDEIDTLRVFEAFDNLRWVKECFLSSLCQEVNWEKEIEEGLKYASGDVEHANTPPTLLIQMLHEKIESNLNVIHSLEKQINLDSLKHKKEMEDVTNKTKEKYKQKAEKAIKEMKEEEMVKHEEEILKLREEESDHLTQALKAQREIIMKDVGNLQQVKDEVVALQKERNNMKMEFELLRKDIEQCRRNESEYKEKLEKSEKERKVYETMMESKVYEEVASKNEMLEKMKMMEQHCSSLKETNDLKRCEIEELKTAYKEKLNEQSESIASLEYQIISLKHNRSTLERKVETLDEFVKDFKEKENLLKQEEAKVKNLSKEINELLSLNETIKSNLEDAQNEGMKEKEISKEIKEELDSALANLSDLKGDLSDKEKQKMEQLEEKCSKQEKELVQQQIHLVKLSTLVDEQMIKLIEQDKLIKEQYDMLADRHIPWARKEVKSVDGLDDYASDVKEIGERCLGSRHDEIIKEQRNVIKDMEHSLASVPVVQTFENQPKQHLVEMANTIDDLKDELVAQEHHSAVTDQKLYTEVCRLQEEVACMNAELSSEQVAHQNNIRALEQSEGVYLTFVRGINKELDIEEILGGNPLTFSLDNEREGILTERGKGLEVIVSRIKSIKSRIVRKDQLLESYDDDLKKYRETENYADRKSFEVEALQGELSESRSELSYLQEALKKYRGECDDLKRQNMSLKQNKVLLMDYKKNENRPSASKQQKKSKQKKLISDTSATSGTGEEST